MKRKLEKNNNIFTQHNITSVTKEISSIQLWMDLKHIFTQFTMIYPKPSEEKNGFI